MNLEDLNHNHARYSPCMDDCPAWIQLLEEQTGEFPPPSEILSSLRTIQCKGRTVVCEYGLRRGPTLSRGSEARENSREETIMPNGQPVTRDGFGHGVPGAVYKKTKVEQRGKEQACASDANRNNYELCGYALSPCFGALLYEKPINETAWAEWVLIRPLRSMARAMLCS